MARVVNSGSTWNMNLRRDILNDLKQCYSKRDLPWGWIIHAKAAESSILSDMYVANELINMYRKCGCMVIAHCIFANIDDPNVVQWNTLLLGYAENGKPYVALDLFSTMKLRGYIPNSVTYIAVIKSCTSLAISGDHTGCLERGKQVHREIGSQMKPYLQNTLIDMYAKCASMFDAIGIFEDMQNPDVVSWNALLLGYAENGQPRTCLDKFLEMKESGYIPDSVTYIAAIKACTALAVSGNADEALGLGRGIHSEMGCHLTDYLRNTLVDMYANCGSMLDAQSVFDSIQRPDIVTWNTLLLGYAVNGEGFITLDLFTKLKEVGFTPNPVTYIAVLKACTCLAVNGDESVRICCLEQGRKIHSEICCEMMLNLQNTIIDMYTNCGSMLEAHAVFDSILKPDVVSWNALLLGYAENGEGYIALNLFSRMKTYGCLPDSVTYIASLKACGLVGALALGRKFHSQISDFPPLVVTCLVDFYAKCGSIVEASEVFEMHSKARTVSTWNALIAGYGRFGESCSVFRLFDAMQDEGVCPDAVTFLCLLLCCSHAGLAEKAIEFFEAMLEKHKLSPTIKHYNCMVDVLGRGNQLEKAIALIRKMPCKPDVVTWTTLLGACKKWKNVDVGREAYDALEKNNASRYLLMAGIYGNMQNPALE